MISLYQGDSSDLIVLKEKSGTILDSNWNAKLVVVRSEKSPEPLIEKLFDKNSDNTAFVCVLEPAETTNLEPGEYIIGMEVENSSLKFRREVREKLRVMRQVVDISETGNP